MDLNSLSHSASVFAAAAPTQSDIQPNAQAAEEFEALVLSQLLAPMFDTAKSNSLFGGDGPEQDAFQSMMIDEYAQLLAARGGVGIADSVNAALLEMQSQQIDSMGMQK